jgi:hypothetical protein
VKALAAVRAQVPASIGMETVDRSISIRLAAPTWETLAIAFASLW